MTVSRRDFLRSTAAVSATLMIPATLEAMAARIAQAASLEAAGYGPLVRDPDGLLDLPAGFHYRMLSSALEGTTQNARFSKRLTNGDPVPSMHDGMAAFAGPEGITILVRNHELNPGQTPYVDQARALPYDPLARGGTTTLWVDSERKLLRSFASLSGTWLNCAGGPTPWGSWLSCEETVFMPGEPHREYPDRTRDASRPHGYVFEVDSRAEALVEPTPIRAMGRFMHEAVAVDPETGFVYLTEDRDDGLLYRYKPDAVTRRGGKKPSELALGDLAIGGALESLRIVNIPGADTRNWDEKPAVKVGKGMRVDWDMVPNPNPDRDMERNSDATGDEPKNRPSDISCRMQGRRFGAARFARNEGITYHNGSMYLCSTTGGKARTGQVWQLELRKNELTLMVEPNKKSLLNMPDNLTPAPTGDLFTCEDNKSDNYVSGITRQGKLYRFAHNVYNDSEFAGACFSPDGRTLFVNLQNPGVTYAVWGPWANRTA